MEGSTLKQRPAVTDTPAVKVSSVKMRIPINEPEKSSSGQPGQIQVEFLF